MRFTVGPKPYSADFDPSGWNEVRVPPSWLIALAGLLTALALAGLVVGLFAQLAPDCLRLKGSGYRHWQLILLFFLAIPLHELVHALLQPGLGRLTTFGFSPRKMVFFAFFPGPRSRGQILLGAAGPFVALSILPALVASVADLSWWGLAALAFINAFGSASDINGFLFVLVRIPAGAQVMALSHRGYWRLSAPPAKKL